MILPTEVQILHTEMEPSYIKWGDQKVRVNLTQKQAWDEAWQLLLYLWPKL